MYEAKTKPTDLSVADYLASIEAAERRADCERLVELMEAVTGAKPVMWGTSIVGFGCYHYRYASGHEGDAAVAGFSSRKSDISVYLVAESADRDALLARLGKHKMAKACLRIKRLRDVDIEVLRALVAASVEEVRRRYGGGGCGD